MLRLGGQILALKVLEMTCNQTLKLDPVAWAQIQHIQGQRISLLIEDWPLEFCIDFSGTGIHFPIGPMHISQVATTQVKAKMSDLLKLIKAEDKQAALANSDIEINGRSGLLLQLANIVQHLDLDWASAIQPFISPVVTQALVKGSDYLQASGQSKLNTFKQDLKAYVLNEQPMTPHAWEVETFSEGVSQLRARTDRLHARIQRLQHRLSQCSDNRISPKTTISSCDPSSGQYSP
jgi:ubiquinone biosynthesis protein UbiJ